MNILSIIFRLLPFLIRIAELIFPEQGSGKIKKGYVKDAAKTVVDTMIGISTGGQRETWEIIEPAADLVIDTTVNLLFPHKDDNDTIDDE